ncbi:hypothetical protein QWY86_13975 [Pedobacter aquatilis]|uniref:hypothetical protein n=1 Tax=Pedobacter aquatilis TaxID=351343 RepID=UPI0025B4E51C|nr:hypothetical protein [Pedobacter aquatilis]MDN3587786.1 hypothetical protein [Pedobacter aquatilis]
MKKAIFLAFVASIAVKTYAQQNISITTANTNYAVVNTKTTANVSTVVNINTNDPQERGGDSERSKSFSKSFSVDNGDKVNLNNQYGAMVIKTWDKKEVKVDVEIKAYSTSDSDAQKLIDDVSIDASKSGDVVSYKTNVGDRSGRYGRNVKNGMTTWRREVKVNYTVYMPSVNALTVLQQYGNVDLGDFSGPTSLKVQYGNLTAGNLSNSNNYVNVQYGKATIEELNTAIVKHQYGGGVSIGAVNTIDLDAQYVGVNINTIRKSADLKVQYGSGLTVGNIGGNLLLNAEYAKVNINNIKGNTVIKQGYGSLTLANVGKLSLKSEYTNVSLGTLNGDANINMSYNKLNIAELTPACKTLTFDGEYVGIGVGFDERYAANFNVTTTYAGFKYGSNVSASKTSGDYDQTKRYTGKVGNGGNANITIKSEYGSVVFK